MMSRVNKGKAVVPSLVISLPLITISSRNKPRARARYGKLTVFIIMLIVLRLVLKPMLSPAVGNVVCLMVHCFIKTLNEPTFGYFIYKLIRVVLNVNKKINRG